MLDEIRKIGVFTVRNFRMLLTYKLAFSSSFLSIIFNFMYLVLFGSMFASSDISIPEHYNGDFISYILIGSIGWGFLWNIMSSTSTGIRVEMMMGTLESIMLTKTKMYTVMIAYTLFGCIFGLLSLIALTVIGIVFFDFTAFSSATVFTLLIFLLSAIMMMGFGMIFGGLTVWIKNIGETVPLIQNITTFFSNVYFPLSVLPIFCQKAARFNPFYYSIQGLRLSFDPSTDINILLNYVMILLVIAVVVNIIGLYTLHLGVKKAKKDGSLLFY